MIVYRLEYKGFGIFGRYSGDLLSGTEDSLYNLYGNTTPASRTSSNFRFACRTPEKLVEYFGSDFAHAIAKGATVEAYEVNRKYVMYGYRGIELAFQRQHAKHLTGMIDSYTDQPPLVTDKSDTALSPMSVGLWIEDAPSLLLSEPVSFW